MEKFGIKWLWFLIIFYICVQLDPVNMSKLVVALCCVVMIHTVSGALSRGKDEKPDCFKDQPGCYVAPLKKVLAYGAEETGPECTRYICFNDDSYSIATCGTYSCSTIPGDSSASYPDCCPKPNPAPGEPCTGY